MPMEVAYYSAKCASLPPVCFHCGGVACAPLADDESILELRNILLCAQFVPFVKTVERNQRLVEQNFPKHETTRTKNVYRLNSFYSLLGLILQ